jgi:hypothetical protein
MKIRILLINGYNQLKILLKSNFILINLLNIFFKIYLINYFYKYYCNIYKIYNYEI